MVNVVITGSSKGIGLGLALWDGAVAAFGSVDIWINNAGLARTTWSVVDTPDDQIETMITSNLLGTTLGSKVALRGMRAQGHGKLFNMLGGGSDGEYFPGMGVYGATKRGMDYLTNALVRENAGSDLVIAKIRWLSGGKIGKRMMLARFKTVPDKFEQFGF